VHSVDKCECVCAVCAVLDYFPFKMAIKHNPTNSLAFNNRGTCLFNLNRLDEALASFDMALKHNPNNSLAINNRKILLEKLKSKAKSQCKQQ